MKHFEFNLWIGLDLLAVEWQDISVPYTQARGVKLELWFLFRSDANPYFKFLLDLSRQQGEFLVIVQDGNAIFVSSIDQVSNIVNVLTALKPVADHVGVVLDRPRLFQVFHNIQIKSRGGFDVDIVFQCLVQHMLEMRAFGAVAVKIFAHVLVLFHRLAKPFFGLNDVF